MQNGNKHYLKAKGRVTMKIGIDKRKHSHFLDHWTTCSLLWPTVLTPTRVPEMRPEICFSFFGVIFVFVFVFVFVCLFVFFFGSFCFVLFCFFYSSYWLHVDARCWLNGSEGLSVVPWEFPFCFCCRIEYIIIDWLTFSIFIWYF